MIITAHRKLFEERCRQRSVSVSIAMGCIVSQTGDLWEIDTEHADYPKPPPKRGPGTELKRLLAGWPFYITSSPDCSCNRVAREMDAWGADECEKPERMDYILAALRDNAAKRGLPFLDAAGRLLVRRAIANARRNA